MRKLFFYPFLFFLVCCSDVAKEKILLPVFTEIQKHSTDIVQYRKLLTGIDTLTGEEKNFWLSIAEDSTYIQEQRAWAVFMLLKRHVKAGMKLKELPVPFAEHVAFEQRVEDTLRRADSSGRTFVSRTGFGRLVVRPGISKDISYYLHVGRRHFEDSSFVVFKERVKRKGWKLLKVNCGFKDAGKELKVYMAFKNCNAETLNAQLYGKAVSLSESEDVLMDFYVPDFEVLQKERNDEDDL